VKKRIALIGDSIRLGYQEIVRELLTERAEIWSPEENCMHSLHHLFHLQPWYVDPAADIIHFNFGLWDCRRLERGSAENAVPVEVFARNLDFILRKVRAATTARIIWATITPVVQERYNARFSETHDPCREASDVELYNAVAAPVLLRHGIVVNDLHAFVDELGRDCLICEDGFHFTEQGNQLLGRQVAKVISSDL
jgi:lysophospholipase L1-like esterase